MKKGFTLVELLAVFALMSAIMLLAAPAITGMLKKAEEGKINTFKENIFLSAEAYLSDNRDEYLELREVDKLTYVRINNLLKSYLNSNIINPYSNNQLKDDKDDIIILIYKNSENIYEYKLLYLENMIDNKEINQEEKINIINALNSMENLTSTLEDSKKEEILSKINLLSNEEIKTAMLNRYNTILR